MRAGLGFLDALVFVGYRRFTYLEGFGNAVKLTEGAASSLQLKCRRAYSFLVDSSRLG